MDLVEALMRRGAAGFHLSDLDLQSNEHPLRPFEFPRQDREARQDHQKARAGKSEQGYPYADKGRPKDSDHDPTGVPDRDRLWEFRR